MLSFHVLGKILGTIPGVFGTTSWLGTLPLLLDTGNYTEEYALPFQFLIILSCLQLLKRETARYWAAIFGFSAIACLLLRPNLVGLSVASIVVLAIRMRNWKKLLSYGMLALSVGISILLFVSLFFSYFGAFTEFFDAVIQYNFTYIRAGLFSIQDCLYIAWKLFTANGLLYIALPMCLVGGVYVTTKRQNLERSQISLVLLGLLAFPIEAGLSVVSGRGYLHYYIAWLPTLAIFVALFGFFLIKICKENIFRSRVVSLILVLLSFCFLLPIGFHIYARVEFGDAWRDLGQRSIEYIKQGTSPEDSVLMWGAETGVNFASGRRSPSRFTYQYPLFDGAEDVEEFVSDVRQNAPALIFDAASTVNTLYVDAPSIASLISQTSDDIEDASRQWRSFADYLAENYEVVDVLGDPPTEWFVYQRIERSSTEKR